MRSIILVVACVLSLLIAGCQPVTSEEATVQYCRSLASFNAARLAVKGLDENSTVDEVHAAMGLLETAFRDVQRSASAMKSAEIGELEQAYDDLNNLTRTIEGSMTVGDVQASVQESVAAIDAAWDQLYTAADCGNVIATPEP